jgi:hypothetical protein
MRQLPLGHGVLARGASRDLHQLPHRARRAARAGRELRALPRRRTSEGHRTQRLHRMPSTAQRGERGHHAVRELSPRRSPSGRFVAGAQPARRKMHGLSPAPRRVEPAALRELPRAAGQPHPHRRPPELHSVPRAPPSGPVDLVVALRAMPRRRIESGRAFVGGSRRVCELPPDARASAADVCGMSLGHAPAARAPAPRRCGLCYVPRHSRSGGDQPQHVHRGLSPGPREPLPGCAAMSVLPSVRRLIRVIPVKRIFFRALGVRDRGWGLSAPRGGVSASGGYDVD